MLLCPLPDLHPSVSSVSFIPGPKPLTAVGWREGVWERQLGRNDGVQSSFLLSEWPLLTQEHFVQLPYCYPKQCLFSDSG